MKLDSSNSLSAADVVNVFHSLDDDDVPKGKCVSEPELSTGAAMKACSYADADQTSLKDKHDDDDCTSWSYLFVHNQKVKSIEAQLKKDGRTYFVHKTIKYVPRQGKRAGMREVAVPSISGLIFLRGNPKQIQTYLDERFLHYRLCKNCSTGEVAVIPNFQMTPFMRIADVAPDRIRFLLRPFIYYSKNRTLLRIVSGDYAGLEGYVIRIARDRKLVMDVGGMSVAIGGVFAERFEEVGKNEANVHERATFSKRNLHERNAFIDRYFHQVRTAQDVSAQTENIELLRLQTLSDIVDHKLSMEEAYETFYFMIEEIGYYYAPFIDQFKAELTPLFEAGQKVMLEIERLVHTLPLHDSHRQQWEAEVERLKANYGYLFE